MTTAIEYSAWAVQVALPTIVNDIVIHVAHDLDSAGQGQMFQIATQKVCILQKQSGF